MGILVTKDGVDKVVATKDELAKATAEGYAPPTGTLVVKHPAGNDIEVTPEQALGFLDREGFSLPGIEETFKRERGVELERDYGGTLSEIQTIGERALGTVTLGLSDALASDETQRERRLRAEVNPDAALLGDVGGGLVTLGAGGAGSLAKGLSLLPGGMAVRGSAALGTRFAGEGLKRALISTGVTTAAEGALFGVGQGVSELALSENPVTAERIIATLSEKALYGGVIGGGLGVAGRGAEAALLKGRRAVEAYGQKLTSGAADELTDIAKLDRQGLQARKELEVARWKTERDSALSSLTSERELEIARLGRERAERIAAYGAEGAEEIAAMDRATLRAERVKEFEVARQTRATEVATENAAIADEILAWTKATKQKKPWLSTQAYDEAGTRIPNPDGELREIAAVTYRADKSLRKITDNLKSLKERPWKARDALQVHEQALERLASRADDIRAGLVAEGRDAGFRSEALDSVDELLQKNRAIQDRMARLKSFEASPASTPRLQALDDAADDVGRWATSSRLDELENAVRDLKAQKPASAALDAIDEAKANLASGGGLFETLKDKAVRTGTTGLATAVGGAFFGPAGATVGAFMGPELAKLLTGRLGKASAAVAARTGQALGALSRGADAAAKVAPVGALTVLSGTSFGPKQKQDRKPSKRQLANAFHERASEIRAQTTNGPDGRTAMTPEAREAVASVLSGLRHVAPFLADMMETVAARRVSFLADKLPKRPDVMAVKAGPDTWTPSDYEIAKFARYVRATQEPAEVIERLNHGTLTPEDREAFQAVYPEWFNEIKMDLITRLPEIRQTLPYKKKLALSIFFDAPVVPSMDPRILRVLQSTYNFEPGTEGGTMGQLAKPQFGSIKKTEEPTPAQERAG
jgi:hypothetical protein